MRLFAATEFLHAEYRYQFVQWEIAEVFRKLYLTGFIMLLPQEWHLLLTTTYYSLPTTYYLLLTTYYLLMTHY
jgi:hypothetical protein